MGNVMRILLFWMAAAMFLALPSPVGAQIITNIPECADRNGNPGFVTGRITAACVPAFIAHVIMFIYSLVGVFFILNIMYAGYQIAMAGAGVGDDEAGKQRLKWAIVGFVMTLSTYLILETIVRVFVVPYSPA